MKTNGITNILFMFLFLFVSIVTKEDICISKRLNQTEEISKIREASKSTKGKYFILIFGRESQDFKNLKSFTDFLNSSFNTVLEIALYCSEDYNPGFHLILIENKSILAENQIKHISKSYLKELFEKNNINKHIESKLKTNLIQMKVKHKMFKNQIKIDNIRNSLIEEKASFQTDIYQKIDYINSSKEKYEMKLTSGLIDLRDEKTQDFGDRMCKLFIKAVFGYGIKYTKHIFIVISIMFVLSFLIIALVKNSIDWLVSIKSKNIPQLNEQNQRRENINI